MLTHVLLQHCVPVGQATQVAPPVPQNSLLVPIRQVPLVASQQPLEQLTEVHTDTQVCSRHSWPVGQLTQVVPPLPQAVLAVPGLQV